MSSCMRNIDDSAGKTDGFLVARQLDSHFEKLPRESTFHVTLQWQAVLNFWKFLIAKFFEDYVANLQVKLIIRRREFAYYFAR